jgi:hypothetical protein
MPTEYFRTQTKNIEAMDQMKKCVCEEDEDDKKHSLNFIEPICEDECEVLTMEELHDDIVGEYGMTEIIAKNIRWGDLIQEICETNNWAVVIMPNLNDPSDSCVMEYNGLTPLNGGWEGGEFPNGLKTHQLYVVRPLGVMLDTKPSKEEEDRREEKKTEVIYKKNDKIAKELGYDSAYDMYGV